MLPTPARTAWSSSAALMARWRCGWRSRARRRCRGHRGRGAPQVVQIGERGSAEAAETARVDEGDRGGLAADGLEPPERVGVRGGSARGRGVGRERFERAGHAELHNQRAGGGAGASVRGGDDGELLAAAENVGDGAAFEKIDGRTVRRAGSARGRGCTAAAERTALAREAAGRVSWGDEDVSAPQFRREDAPADEDGRERLADGLDLWECGHGGG